jgi:hypothetical protein
VRNLRLVFLCWLGCSSIVDFRVADLAAPHFGPDFAKNDKCSTERDEEFKGKCVWLWVRNCGYRLRFLFGENLRFLITVGD